MAAYKMVDGRLVLDRSRFQKGSGCYTCRSCGKRTRETDPDAAGVKLCEPCWEKAGDDNCVADGVITEEQFQAKWHEPSTWAEVRA